MAKKEKKKSSKAKKAVKIIAIILAIIIILPCSALFVITRDWESELREYDTGNSFITPLGTSMVAAHRSGGGIFPENTMMAFKGCVGSDEFKTDIFEFDLHITKDDKLIILHDETLDRTTDVVETLGVTDAVPENFTYDELRQLNFGESFTDKDGNMPYKGLRGDEIPDDLKVLQLEDVLDFLEANGDYGYIIEIKNSNELGYKSADMLYNTLKEKNMLDKVVVGTFNGEVTAYLDEAHPDMMRSASIKEVVKFYFDSLFKLNRPQGYYKYSALQIPANQFIIHLGTSRLVDYAHQNGIAVQFWTINDADDIKALYEIGADGITTDVPDLAYQVILQQ